jgi:hypothetical protein
VLNIEWVIQGQASFERHSFVAGMGDESFQIDKLLGPK